ncbi:hypothetical protein B296_00007216 [Ensete ventricosum]|uniref:Uncharacterized protein n=1 Tax=Ensete ventricosum TaxID=4639 RepID=A0A427AMU6_ENSVE|nr:hypothetical protein B296_00007216 [Ensete ventricosum]
MGIKGIKELLGIKANTLEIVNRQISPLGVGQYVTDILDGFLDTFFFLNENRANRPLEHGEVKSKRLTGACCGELR